ncbi:MAG: polymer-forming cytoskeletal protein [Chloroflexaceae bacterium]|jgi:hypothetical protein|nr:polymer-forming cytoskeletal protein [Chloroflexaceae bacterium]
MKARFIWLLALLLACVCFAAPAYAGEGEPALEVGVGVVMPGNVSTVRQDVVINGEVQGDVTSWLGNITVNGRVRGDVVSYSGAISLGSGAQVDGHVLALSGQVQREPAAQLSGQVIGNVGAGSNAVASLLTLVLGESGAGRMSQGSLSLGLALAALLTMGGLALVWPRRLEGASRTLVALPGRSLALGLVTALLTLLLVPLASGVLAATLLGLPLVLALLLLLQLPYLAGLAALAQALGQRMLRGPNHPLLPLLLGAAPLLLALLALGTLALSWGAVLFYLLASVGLGALILSRGGAFAPA